MQSVRVAVIGALVVSGLVGCRNRVADERDALYQQTREQDERIRAMNEREMAQANTPPAPAPVTPPPAPAPVTPPPAPAPAPPPDLSSLQGIEGAEPVSNPNAGTVTLNLSGDIFFDSGAASIKSAARSSLDKVASALRKDYAGKDVRIEGHTDSDPIRRSKWKSNQELSEARANAVRDYLVKKGVDAGSISTIGHGADMPRGQDKARNRRVEVVVLVDANAPNARRSQPAAVTPEPVVEEPELNK